MTQINILKISDPFIPNPRRKLNDAAQQISKQTGFSITPTATGFAVSGEWRGKFPSEEEFARRIVRNLAIASEVMFESTIE